MSRMDANALEEAARAWAHEVARTAGLDADAVAVHRVPSWGGFSNASFHVVAGARRYHLKLTASSGASGLRTWHRVHELLSGRYHAPQMLEWLSIPEIECVGAVFVHLDGSSPRTLGPWLAELVTAALVELHADAELATRLEAPPATCFDHYLENHERRFREDVAGIVVEPPPFLSEGDVPWMREEVALLHDAIRGSPAFQDPAAVPVHGDLWLENLLVSPNGGWHMLDWDDIRLGDRVLDFATLFGPCPSDVRPLEPSRLPAAVALSAAERERLRLYARATLLDWVIDPLSDWIDAPAAGADEGRVRIEKERVHRAAKALYLETYGRGAP